jgi:hypothetical protein
MGYTVSKFAGIEPHFSLAEHPRQVIEGPRKRCAMAGLLGERTAGGRLARQAARGLEHGTPRAVS